MRKGWVLAVAFWVGGCAPEDLGFTPLPDLGQREGELVGVPQNGYPNYNERLMLVTMNRVRSDPNNIPLGTKAACSTDFGARPPLVPSYNGSRAARFHCQNLLLTHSGLSHKSYCTLRSDIGATNCDGSAACACVAGSESFNCTTLGGTGTDPWTRAGYFSFSASGEIGLAGYGDAWQGVWGWVSECTGSDGHRVAVTSGSYGQAGLGWAAGAGGCWSSFGFSDLASGGGAPPVLPAGAHRPETGSASTSFDFYVNYYDLGGAPSSVNVVIDSVCYPMTQEIGVSPTNATYKTSRVVGSGCHEYWFLAQDSSGTRRVWPEVGSWEVGSCSAYRSTAAAANCEGCVVGVACSSPDGCASGTTACSGGTQTCSNLTPVANGTSCGSNQVCFGGSCVACTSGSSCTSLDGCKSGNISCATGQPVCGGLVSRPNGTACGQGGHCQAGTCVPPSADAGTADAGTVDSGVSDAGSPADAGTPDSGVPDAGSAADAGVPDADAGPPIGVSGDGGELPGSERAERSGPPSAGADSGGIEGGCGCVSTGRSGGIAFLTLALTAMATRRSGRRKQASRGGPA